MTEKQKIGYKVLRQSRVSIIMGHSAKGAGRKYPKGIEVKPKKGCGPLCVFDTLWNASYWSNTGLIVRCKYIPSIHLQVWKDTEYYKIDLLSLPIHTILADSVTCLE